MNITLIYIIKHSHTILWEIISIEYLYDQTGKDFISESKQYLRENPADEAAGTATVVHADEAAGTATVAHADEAAGTATVAHAVDEDDSNDRDKELVIEAIKDLTDTYMTLEELDATETERVNDRAHAM